MKKEYLCHGCGTEFELPGDREPACPECESQEVTFEGYVEPSVINKIFSRLKPLLNLLIFPWKYYEDRRLNRPAFWLLVLLSTATLLAAGIQVRQLDTISPLGKLSLLEQVPASFPAFFRGYHRFLPALQSPGRFPQLLPGWLVVYCVLVVWELLSFVVLHSVFFFAGAREPAKRIAAVSAGTIWIPNLLLGGLFFILGRGATHGLWGLGFLAPDLFRTIYGLIGFWLIYSFLGGLVSIEGVGTGRFLSGLVAALALQTVLASVVVLILNAMVFSALGLIPLGGGLVKASLELVLWPWFLFLF